MVISIVQPCFVPWLGYFEQIAVADIFVYMDDVQYTKKDWRNNNQLKTSNGIKGISFPVKKAPRDTLIKNIEISYNSDWEAKFMNQLFDWYKRAEYYNEIVELIRDPIHAKYNRLCDLNLNLNNAILGYLGIDTKVFFSSDIKRASGDKIDRIAEICTNFEGVNTLFDGKKARNFLDQDSLQIHGISVKFQDYQHKSYQQLYGKFVPYMSIIDLIMNCGKDSMKFILTSKV